MLTEPQRTGSRQPAPLFDDRPRAARLRVWGLALLGAFALLSVVTMVKLLKGPDQSADESLNRFALSHGGLTDFLKAVTQAGEPTVALGVGLLAALFFHLRRMRDSAKFAAVSVIGAYAIAYLGKVIVHRHRPRWDAAHTVVADHGPSFPSGHATGSAALATVLILAAVPMLTSAFVRRVATVALVLFALTMVVSRPILGVHFPTDVLAGALLGSGWSLLCASALRPWRDRPSAR